MKTAMRIGDWKILADEPLTQFELYNVQRDPQEKSELSAAEPAKFAEMKATLVKLNTEIEAEGPTCGRLTSTPRGKGSARSRSRKRKSEARSGAAAFQPPKNMGHRSNLGAWKGAPPPGVR